MILFVCQVGYPQARKNQLVSECDDNFYRGVSFISNKKGNVRNRGKKLIRKTKKITFHKFANLSLQFGVILWDTMFM